MGSSQQKIPKAPNAAKLYQQGIDVMLKNLPQLLSAEETYREAYDPRRVKDFLTLQNTYGPQQTQEQLDRLHQFDPTGTKVREQLGSQIYSDLKSGYSLPPEFKQELEQDIRGDQAARGNILGKGAGSAESVFKGKNAIDLYQQHIDNAGQFLHAPTPEQQALTIPAVQPDRSAGYVNPAAGLQGQQFGLQNFSNLLAQYQLSGQGGGGNAWQRALRGASIGASQGGSFGGVWGALGGAVGGGIDGAINGPIYQYQTQGSYSDIRLKENIIPDGEENGIPYYTFNFTGDPNRYRGPIAQEVLLLKPELVGEDSQGYLTVDYLAL